MKNYIVLAILALLLMPSLASAAPQEAMGLVTNVVDGDTLDVQGIGRVRLADIDCPEMDTSGGAQAKDYTAQWLQDRLVYLDLDNKTGKDQYDRWIAVVYMANPDGSVETSTNFNRMLVDSGNACIWDFSDNEFSPASWWNGTIPATACIKSDSSGPAKPFVGATSAWAGPGQGARSGMESQNYFTASQTSSAPESAVSNGPFVGSAKSDKYHYPSCSAAKRIKPGNLVTFSSSADARASGYVPCGICHPP